MIRTCLAILALLCGVAGPAEARLHGGSGLPQPPALVGGDPGPSLTLYNDPPYTCLANRYVNVGGAFTDANGHVWGAGSDSNPGTSFASPWQTIDHANSNVSAAGSCITLAPGVNARTTPFVTASGGNTATPTGYIVWRCSVMPFSFLGGGLQGEGSGCVIRATAVLSTGSASVIDVEFTPYIMLDALEVDGNDFNAEFDCIAMNQNTHHVWVLNSDLHGCGWDGISGVDYTWVLHSVVHGNSGSSVFAPSSCCGSGIHPYEPQGITPYTRTTMDDQWCVSGGTPCFNIVFDYNVIYSNINPSGYSDGSGIEFDDWSHVQNPCPGSGFICPYTANSLALGNLIFNNGGSAVLAQSGLSSSPTNTSAIWVVNNSSFANEQGPSPSAIYGEFASLHMNNGQWLNDISVDGSSNAPFAATADGSGNLWQTNLSYPGGQNQVLSPNSYPTTGTNHNLDGSNPLFTSATVGSVTNNFALQGGSPAIGFGQLFYPLWPQGSAIDSGACVHLATSCP